MEIDSELLGRLRASHPGEDDRALLSGPIELGLTALRDAPEAQRARRADRRELGVRAVHVARRLLVTHVGIDANVP